MPRQTIIEQISSSDSTSGKTRTEMAQQLSFKDITERVGPALMGIAGAVARGFLTSVVGTTPLQADRIMQTIENIPRIAVQYFARPPVA